MADHCSKPAFQPECWVCLVFSLGLGVLRLDLGLGLIRPSLVYILVSVHDK